MLREHYSVGDFVPLIVLFVSIGFVSVMSVLYFDLSLVRGMQVFMGVFFSVFGFLKVIKLKAFAEAYRMYDLIAARSSAYAYAYPFIELSLGAAYLTGFTGNSIHWITAAVMGISATGVYVKLRKGEKIMCACLGTVFAVPMTWVTLLEDLLMLAMALYMIAV